MSATKKNSEKVQTRIKYTYTDKERINLAIEQARAAQKVAELEEEKASVNEQFKAKIKVEEARIGELSNKVTSGYEFREVSAIVHYQTPKKGEKTYKDPNTGEILKVEKMEAPDYQADLRLGNAPGVKKAPEPEPERPEEEKATAKAQAFAIAKGAKAQGKKAAKAKAQTQEKREF